jgi:hypothetical protein
MNYEIVIEGGFTGIPKEYKGDIDLREETKENLFKALDRKLPPENTALRDGLQYHLTLIDGDQEQDARFDEQNLPLPVRQFIDTVSTRNK